jgi:hypothetical protein
MTVTQTQIDRVRQAGFVNVELMGAANNRVSGRFYLTISMFEKETRGRNVYGHDAGGALSGFPREVNEENFRVFEWLVFTKGQDSNGVGPSQITSKGLLTDMKTVGLKPWVPADNIFYGAKLITGYYRNARDIQNLDVWESVRYAGRRYNGASAYGDSLVTIAKKWREILGNADYA